MKNILLVCAAGMSTSMLVKRMQEHAAAMDLAVNINALAISEAKEKIKNNLADVVLLGPQVRFQKNEIEEVAQRRIPVAVIDMKYYGQMAGQAVLDSALALLANK
ncbi:PTS system cellobiose-specific IIB component [Raoultella sp. BIGb0138]|uniref:PTS sugar transporter subunit IIB n=1 Tax=Raoultella sp. BIGb0138 TaxID=2485115 RepID=UPI001052CABC|nr:PTS sugar transporter subunit IIB [Raoultella sp. BIGb0138]TCW18030.1 PTS system cellobiose-specific IIB component [Raoultella sp. BIGb0138]